MNQVLREKYGRLKPRGGSLMHHQQTQNLKQPFSFQEERELLATFRVKEGEKKMRVSAIG